jgi:outer membrane protein OmpA-like peptidoglycan-associated protein
MIFEYACLGSVRAGLAVFFLGLYGSAIAQSFENERVTFAPPWQQKAPKDEISLIGDLRAGWLQSSESGLVIVYPAMQQGQRIHLYLNGQFITSIKPAQFALTKVCAQEVGLTLVVDDNAVHALIQRSPDLVIHPKGFIHLEVTKSEGQPYSLREKTAEQPTGTTYLRQQKIVLGASDWDCKRPFSGPEQADFLLAQNEPAVELVISPKDTVNVTSKSVTQKWVADFSFAFKDDGQESLPLQIEARILKQVQEIKSKYLRIDRLVFVGHTDPVGVPHRKPLLSKRRADTVRQLFEQQGLHAELVETTGKGDTEVLVATCTEQFASRVERNRCNEPNRRVEVFVEGIPVNPIE